MKKRLTFIISILFIVSSIKAVTITITTGVSGSNTFSPSSINVTVGDSIKWVWATGDHTTTSTTIPLGAPAWNAPLDNTHQTFVYVVMVQGTYNYKCIPHETMGMIGSFTASPIGIIQISSNVPESFQLYQNFPNPFNPSTKIKFDVPRSSFTTIKIYNILGGEIAVLVNEHLQPGSYETDWDASDYPSGVYYYKLTAVDFIETRKMNLVK